MRATTRDIGLAIRDFLEDRDISVFREVWGELEETPNAHHVDHIDVSDPNNLRVHLNNGQMFVICILAK